MTPSREANDVLAALQGLATGSHQKKLKGYFTTSQRLLGVNNPGIRLVVKECRRSLHTWEKTQLSERTVGERVNVEGDHFGKWVEVLLERRGIVKD